MAKVQPTNINILNGLRNKMSLAYAERIPAATVDNVNAVYDNLLNYNPVRNEFVNALVGILVYQQIETQYFKNPLNSLKMSPMQYGQTEQEIFINMAKAHDFNQFAGVEDLFRFYESNIMTAFHSISPARQYAVTVTYDNLRTAFSNEYGIRSLIDGKVQSLYSGAEWDDYLIMKRILESAYKNGYVYAEQVTAPEDDVTGRELTRKLKSLIMKIKFPNPLYNIAGATSAANDEGIYYMVTPETDALLSTEVLAYAFNMDKADVQAHKIIIDQFEDTNIQAAVFDMRFWRVRDQFRTMSDSRNGAALTWNYFYTISAQYSFSPFFPCIVLTTDDVSVSTVELTEVESAKAGDTVEVKYTVTGGTVAPKELDFEIESGATSEHTAFIPGSNRLVLGLDEKGTTINVKATSRYNKGVTATTTVTVS